MVDLEYKKENTQSSKIIDEDELSTISISEYDDLDEKRFKNIGLSQYTCDECSSIPIIIKLDEKTKTITFKCGTHGLKTMSLNTYLFSCFKYNSWNWKCSQCQNIQINNKENNFNYCECGQVFCASCYKEHLDVGHKFIIERDNFDLRCKKSKEHFYENFIGFCHECQVHFCEQCKDDHKWHDSVSINDMLMDRKQVEKIKELNREYEKLITYYKNLIRLNEIIIFSFEKYGDNYYNLNNINAIINNSKRNQIIDDLNYGESGAIIPGKENSDQFDCMEKLYKRKYNEEEQEKIEEQERLEIKNKFFNSQDLKLLTLMPLKNLRLLNLENNYITMIDCLKDCSFKNLVILNLNNNAINDISIFEKMPSNDIQALFLRNNCIEDISVFGKKKFPSLRQLDLRNNKIEDIKVFDSQKEQLPNLQSLYLTNNPFDRVKFDSTLKILEELPDKEY